MEDTLIMKKMKIAVWDMLATYIHALQAQKKKKQGNDMSFINWTVKINIHQNDNLRFFVGQ